VLVLYDPTATCRSKISVDASSFGVGAVLVKENRECEWRPVAFAIHFGDRETLCTEVLESFRIISLEAGLRLRQIIDHW
jgi:hypothetical protein